MPSYPKPDNPEYKDFELSSNQELLHPLRLDDIAWFVAKSSQRRFQGEEDQETSKELILPQHIQLQ